MQTYAELDDFPFDESEQVLDGGEMDYLGLGLTSAHLPPTGGSPGGSFSSTSHTYAFPGGEMSGHGIVCSGSIPSSLSRSQSGVSPNNVEAVVNSDFGDDLSKFLDENLYSPLSPMRSAFSPTGSPEKAVISPGRIRLRRNSDELKLHSPLVASFDLHNGNSFSRVLGETLIGDDDDSALLDSVGSSDHGETLFISAGASSEEDVSASASSEEDSGSMMVNGHQLQELIIACFKVLIPQTEVLGVKDQIKEGSVASKCRVLVQHPLSVCTFLKEPRRYLLGSVVMSKKYVLMGVNGEYIPAEMKLDKDGDLYVDEHITLGPVCAGRISKKGVVLQPDEVARSLIVNPPFPMNSVLPDQPNSDEEARPFLVHLTYTLRVWWVGRGPEPLFHDGVDERRVWGKSKTEIQGELFHEDPIQTRVWNTYLETRIRAEDFLTVAKSVCSAGGKIRLFSHGRGLRRIGGESSSSSCSVSLKDILPAVEGGEATQNCSVVFPIPREEESNNEEDEEEEDSDDDSEDSGEEEESDAEASSSSKKRKQPRNTNRPSKKKAKTGKPDGLGPFFTPVERPPIPAQQIHQKEIRFLKARENISGEGYERLLAEYGAPEGEEFPVIKGIIQQVQCKEGIWRGTERYCERGSPVNQMDLCTYLLHEKAKKATGFQVVAYRFSPASSAICLSVFSDEFVGVVDSKSRFIMEKNLDRANYTCFPEMRFRVPDGRYEMTFSNWYGKNARGTKTGEGGLTADWKAFQDNPNAMMDKYGVSVEADRDLFMDTMRSHSRSVFVHNGYLILPDWMLLKMGNDTPRECVNTEDDATIIFRISDLISERGYKCYMMHSEYVGRVFTRSDFNINNVNQRITPQTGWVPFKILNVNPETKQKLLDYPIGKNGRKSVKKFKKKTGYWFYEKDGALKLKMEASRMEKCMFASQKIRLPTPDGESVEVQLDSHVLPVQVKGSIEKPFIPPRSTGPPVCV